MLTPYYKDEYVTLYHGDSLAIAPLLGTVDHVITDPPYEQEAHTNIRKLKRTVDGVVQVVAEPIPFNKMDEYTRMKLAFHGARLARRWLITFCQFEATHAWRVAYVAAGATHVRIGHWIKPDGMPQISGDRPSGSCAEAIYIAHAGGRMRWNGGGYSAIYTVPKNEKGLKKNPHPTTKPQALMRKLILHFTDPGETILDFCGGSGSTAVACKALGRRCIIIERDLKYCQIAAERIARTQTEMMYLPTEWQPTQTTMEIAA